ncbi:MAG: hypothetical protein Q9212_002129 [Teloschistes hypoglaucus]
MPQKKTKRQERKLLTCQPPITGPHHETNTEPGTEPNIEPILAICKKKTKRPGYRLLTSPPPTTGPNTEPNTESNTEPNIEPDTERNTKPKRTTPKKKTKRLGPKYLTCRRPITESHTEFIIASNIMNKVMEATEKRVMADAKKGPKKPSPNSIRFNHKKGTFVSTYHPNPQFRSIEEHSAMLRECHRHEKEIDKIRKLVTSRREILNATLVQGKCETSEMDKVFQDGVDEAVGKVVKRCDGLVRGLRKKLSGPKNWYIFEIPASVQA